MSYEEFKATFGRFTSQEFEAELVGFGATDREDKELGPVRDFKAQFATGGRPDFDRVHNSVKAKLIEINESGFVTAFNAAEKNTADGRVRVFTATMRVPLLAGA